MSYSKNNLGSMKPSQPEELPRTPGRLSPNPELDPHVEILEFEEKEDHNGRKIGIKQRKKKKANKRRRESGQTSETSGKKKRRKIEAGGSQQTESTEHGPTPAEPEPAQAQTEERPSAPIISLVDYPDEEQSGRPMLDEITILDQSWMVEEIWALTASMPVVAGHSQSRVQMEAGRTTANIDKIVMLAEQSLDAMCKWKDEHDEKIEEMKKTTELTD